MYVLRWCKECQILRRCWKEPADVIPAIGLRVTSAKFRVQGKVNMGHHTASSLMDQRFAVRKLETIRAIDIHSQMRHHKGNHHMEDLALDTLLIRERASQRMPVWAA